MHGPVQFPRPYTQAQNHEKCCGHAHHQLVAPGKHEEAVAANEALVAEIERRNDHDQGEARRTPSTGLERPAATTHW